MGLTYSKNVIRAAISITTKVAIKTLQQCQVKITLEEFLNIANSHGITLNDVTFRESVFFDQTCLSRSDIDTQLRNNIKETINQVEKAISQSLNLTPNSAISKGVANVMDKVSTQITNSFIQNCKSRITEQQTFNISGSSNVLVGDINFKSIVEDTVQCVQRTVDVNNLSNQLDLHIKQKATSKTKGVLGGMMFIIIIIIVIGGAFILMGEKALFDWRLWLALILVVAAYLTLAYFINLWPFHKKKKHTHQSDDVLFS